MSRLFVVTIELFLVNPRHRIQSAFLYVDAHALCYLPLELKLELESEPASELTLCCWALPMSESVRITIPSPPLLIPLQYSYS